VQERRRFVLNEINQDGRLDRYTLRGSGLVLFLRHHTADGTAFNEIFVRRLYDPPPEALAILASRKRPLRVVDLGAHIGLFGVYARASFRDVHVESVEPDPQNLAVLRRCVDANKLRSSWIVHAACAASRDGVVRFHVVPDRSTNSHVAAPDDTATISVPSLDTLRLIRGADFVKIDIEGSEWSILGDDRFARAGVPVYVIEYHSRGCPEDDPRAAAERLLHEAGYRTRFIADQGGGMGMLWAWTSDAL
jgi:FkbM family methyltransferase